MRVLLAALAFAFAAGGGAASAAGEPGAAAQAWAVRVVVPGAGVAGTRVVAAPAGAGPAAGGFSYPRDGSAVRVGATRADATARAHATAIAASSSSADAVSLFGGQITAEAAAASAEASATAGGATGSVAGAHATGLRALGNRVTSSPVRLGDWGILTIGRSGVDRGAPAGSAGYDGYTIAVDVRLTALHRGLPTGTEIQLGYAEAAVQTAEAVTLRPLPQPPPEAVPGDRPQLWPASTGPLLDVPQMVTPRLGGGPYVFPVHGHASFADGFALDAPGGSWDDGDELYASLGQPVLAVAGGTVVSTGWNAFAGYRLRLRDRRGNVFVYAHLSAFATSARAGARVRSGQVVGFVGASGDARGGPPRLHFEIHPVSLLYLGADGAVDPTRYLRSWPRLERLSLPLGAGLVAAPSMRVHAPEPGAVLIGSTDIASGGLQAAAGG